MDFSKKNVERTVSLGIIFLCLLCISKYFAFLAVILGATWVFLRHQTKETVPVKINASPELPDGWESMSPVELKKVLTKNKGKKSELERMQEICSKTANKKAEIREQAKQLAEDLAVGLPNDFSIAIEGRFHKNERYNVYSNLVFKKRFYKLGCPVEERQPWDKHFNIEKTIEFIKLLKPCIKSKLEQMEKSCAELDKKMKE